MRYSLRIIIILSPLLIISCRPVERAENRATPYFDLKGYFQGEAKRLANEQGFEKTVRMDDQTETLQPDTLDWAAEFKAFADADINFPSWFGKYAVDSSFTEGGQLERLTYTVQDTSLRTKFIGINYAEGVPSRIEIRRASKSPLAKTYNELLYIPQEGYTILHRQQLRLAEEKEVEVQVHW